MLDSRFTLSRPPPQAAPFSDEKAFHRISPRFQQRQYHQGPAVANVGASQGLRLQNSARAFAAPPEQIAQPQQQTFQALSEQVQHVVSENDAMLQSLAAQSQAAQNQAMQSQVVQENQNLRQQVRNLQQMQQPDITPTQQLQLLNQQSIHQQTLIDQYQLALRKLTSEIKRLKDAQVTASQVQPQEAFQQTENVENAACQTDLDQVEAPVDAGQLLLSSNQALQENNELLRRENAKLLEQLDQMQASAQNASHDEIINKLNDQLEQTCAANQEVVDRLKSRIEQAQQLADSKASVAAIPAQNPLIAFLITSPIRPLDVSGFLDRLSRILAYCRELQYYSGQQAKSAQYFAELVRFLYSKFMRFQREVADGRDSLKNDMRGVLESVADEALKARIEEVLARH